MAKNGDTGVAQVEKTKKVIHALARKSNLACERAEEVWILQASVASIAEVAGTSKWPRHGPLV